MSDFEIWGRVVRTESSNQERIFFDNPSAAIKHLKHTLANYLSNSVVTFFELRLGEVTIMMQCQGGGILLQVFVDEKKLNDEVGWYNLLEEDVDLGCVDEFVFPCYYGGDKVKETHFQLLGIEGAWASRCLLVGKGTALKGVADISHFVDTGKWKAECRWENLGFL